MGGVCALWVLSQDFRDLVGFRVQGLEGSVSSLGAWAIRFRVQGSGFRVQGLRVLGSMFQG